MLKSGAQAALLVVSLFHRYSEQFSFNHCMLCVTVELVLLHILLKTQHQTGNLFQFPFWYCLAHISVFQKLISPHERFLSWTLSREIIIMWGNLAALDKWRLYQNISWLDEYWLIYPVDSVQNRSPFSCPNSIDITSLFSIEIGLLSFCVCVCVHRARGHKSSILQKHC